MSESKELSHLIGESKQIAATIKQTLEKFKDDPVPYSFSDIGPSRIFVNIASPEQHAFLTASLVRQWKAYGKVLPNLPKGFPKKFTLPVYALRTDQYHTPEAEPTSQRQRVTTSYGVLNEYFLGADNKLYHAMNTLFFNETGQALKAESIKESPFDSQRGLQRVNLDRNTLSKLDIVPKIGMRYVPLDPGDYEKARTILHQIEIGDFIPEKP